MSRTFRIRALANAYRRKHERVVHECSHKKHSGLFTELFRTFSHGRIAITNNVYSIRDDKIYGRKKSRFYINYSGSSRIVGSSRKNDSAVEGRPRTMVLRTNKHVETATSVLSLHECVRHPLSCVPLRMLELEVARSCNGDCHHELDV